MTEPRQALLAAGPVSLLLVRLRSIGDTVLTLPLVEAIRAARPEVRITLALEALSAPLVVGQPGLAEVLVVGRGPRARLSALRKIRQRHFDLAVDLHGGPTAAMLTGFSGAALRVGLASYRSRWAYDLRLPAPAGQPVHTVLANLAIARGLGLQPPPSIRAPRLAIAAAAAAAAAAELVRVGVDPAARYLVVHPWGAMRSKTWSRSNFEELVRRLLARGEVVVVPSAPMHSARLELPGARVPRALDLPTLAALLAGARLLVSNDSGPAHMAAAVGTPVVAIFGSQDPRVWHPWGGGISLWKALPCSPCAGYRCSNRKPFECLEAIGVDEVERAALSVLARSDSPGAPPT